MNSQNQGIVFADREFRKSSLTGSDRYACVEVAMREGVVAVRSTTDPSKTTVLYTNDEWSAFIGGVKKGEFDLPTA